jgi:hypothetical protein
MKRVMASFEEAVQDTTVSSFPTESFMGERK